MCEIANDISAERARKGIEMNIPTILDILDSVEATGALIDVMVERGLVKRVDVNEESEPTPVSEQTWTQRLNRNHGCDILDEEEEVIATSYSPEMTVIIRRIPELVKAVENCGGTMGVALRAALEAIGKVGT